MKLVKSQLKQIIEEELKKFSEIYERGADDLYEDPTEKYDYPVYQLNDVLVAAAKNALLEVVEAQLAPNFSPEEVAAAVDNFELDLEEPLMDFLLPYAERILRDHRAETRRRRG